MKIMTHKGKARLERTNNSLDEFEIIALKLNAEIEILKNEEKKIRNTIDCFKK